MRRARTGRPTLPGTREDPTPPPLTLESRQSSGSDLAGWCDSPIRQRGPVQHSRFCRMAARLYSRRRPFRSADDDHTLNAGPRMPRILNQRINAISMLVTLLAACLAYVPWQQSMIDRARENNRTTVRRGPLLGARGRMGLATPGVTHSSAGTACVCGGGYICLEAICLRGRSGNGTVAPCTSRRPTPRTLYCTDPSNKTQQKCRSRALQSRLVAPGDSPAPSLVPTRRLA